MFDVLCETLRGTGFQWKVFDNIVSFDRELLTKLASGNPQVYISQIRHCFFIKSCFKGFQVLGRFSGKTQTFHQGIKNIVSFLPKTILSEAMSLQLPDHWYSLRRTFNKRQHACKTQNRLLLWRQKISYHFYRKQFSAKQCHLRTLVVSLLKNCWLEGQYSDRKLSEF